MGNHKTGRICITPKVHGVGGMVTFRQKLTAELIKQGIGVTNDLKDLPYDAVLVIGGTKQIYELRKLRKRGTRIVQRLDGMNWMHRVRKWDGINMAFYKHYLRAEYGNYVLRLIRATIATHIVYQSKFSKVWWERVFGKKDKPDTIIYNGVDLTFFQPKELMIEDPNALQILLVEGGLAGGYEFGLDIAVKAIRELVTRFALPVHFMVAGKVSDDLRRSVVSEFDNELQANRLKIAWLGIVSQEEIANLHQRAHLLYSSDINAACPNSVIEALASGLPVVSYDTGAIPELVKDNAGIVVPYEKDPWKMELPNINNLAVAFEEVFRNQSEYRRAARYLAEREFDLNEMVYSYLDVLLG